MTKNQDCGDVSKILCPFCSAPWTDQMVAVFNQTTVETGFYPGELDGVECKTKIDITCESCKRLIYRKEVVKNLEAYGDSYA